MTTKQILNSLLIACTISATAQVGINNDSPKATLDISTSTTLTETDGLLVPRVAAFTTTNPGVDQNSMIVYLENDLTNYTIPGGTSQDYPKGFYSWDNTAVNWIAISGTPAAPALDADWFEQGTTAAPDAISDNIFTNGNVGIGDTTPNGNLHISSTGDTLLIVEGDSDNSGENDNPEIRLVQDGGDGSSIQLIGDNNQIVTGTVANALVLHTRNGQSNAPIQFISRSTLHTTMKTNGQLQLHEYDAANSFTGTATSLLAVDGNGNIVQEPLSAGDASKIIDVDGDTQIQVEESPDEDLIRFDLQGVEHFKMTQKGQLELMSDNTIRIGRLSGNLGFGDRRSVFIGEEAGRDMGNNFYHTAVGYLAMQQATGSSNNGAKNNTAVGAQTLQFSNGEDNTAVGNLALNMNTTGVTNTAIGGYAMRFNTTGSRNVAAGTSVLSKNTTGIDNTGLGYNALGKNVASNGNTAVGSFALWENISGASNTAVGSGSSQRNVSGEKNVSMGDFSLYHNQTGGSNVAIGQGAGFYEQGTNNTFVGRGAGGGDSTMGAGAFKTTSGNVMIGYEAGVFDYNGGNKLYISNSNTSLPLIAGDFGSTPGTTPAGGTTTFPRVGINTNVTTGLTHTLTVNGNVRASEGFSTPTNNYPDYVFEDYFDGSSKINENYKFVPLDEAINFVKENGHLPNVKSYQEVKSNNMDIDLGETSVKNLEKIEENFLYIAELKEMINTLVKENKDLKNRVEVLEKKN